MKQAVYIILCGWKYDGYCRPGTGGTPSEVWYDETLAKRRAAEVKERGEFDYAHVVELWPAEGQDD